MIRASLLLGLLAGLAACAPSAAPDDTPAGRLQAELDVMRQFPSGQVSTRCAGALKELGTTMSAIQALQHSGKAVDPVSIDVLQSDQSETGQACHADVLWLCQASNDPAAQGACSRVAP